LFFTLHLLVTGTGGDRMRGGVLVREDPYTPGGT